MKIRQALEIAVSLPEGARILSFPRIRPDEVDRIHNDLMAIGERRVLVTNFPQMIHEELNGEALSTIKRLCFVLDATPSTIEERLVQLMLSLTPEQRKSIQGDQCAEGSS